MPSLTQSLFRLGSDQKTKFKERNPLRRDAQLTRLQWDLGLRGLLPDWKALFKPNDFRGDLIAGLVVACAAVPLSLAIALASGVSPATGLITAIVAGITCALFGGTPLAVSGPAAAMAVLVNTAVSKHGLSGLLVVTLICGVLQIFSGALRWGRFFRFVPTPVVMGFTAGIGAIIFTGQFPRALGLPAPDPSHVCDVITHLGELFRLTNPLAVVLALTTVGVMLLLPRLLPKIPAALVAVSIPSFVAAIFGWKVETIGLIPSSLPLPKLPAFSGNAGWELLLMGFTVFALASLETLLSSSAVDKLSKGKAHDPDQELIGQGLGNLASAFFGGIPVTGVIARSALNVQAGARTRRAAIIHSLFLIATVFLLSPVISRIPIAVLAGILLSVALRMLSPKELISLWRSSRGDALVYVTTFVVIVAVGLLAGVQAGIAAALLVAAVRLSQLQISAHTQNHEGPFRISLLGPLTFLSSAHIARLKVQLDGQSNNSILFDFSRVTYVDSSGSEQFSALLSHLRQKGARIAVLNASSQLQQMVKHELGESSSDIFLATEAECQTRFQEERPINRLRGCPHNR